MNSYFISTLEKFLLHRQKLVVYQGRDNTLPVEDLIITTILERQVFYFNYQAQVANGDRCALNRSLFRQNSSPDWLRPFFSAGEIQEPLG